MSAAQLCGHGRKICSVCAPVDDTAKRAYDVIRQIVENLGYEDRMAYPYVALKLSDGSSDGKNYDTKQAAVRAQLHEQLCMYFSFKFAPNGFKSPKEAAIMLAYHRGAYDAGFRLPDPDAIHGGRDLIMPTTPEHLGGQLRRFGVN